MSTLLDDTAADVPVRDTTVNLSRLAAGPQDLSLCQNARARQDISRVSREELEDQYLRVHEETLHLKQHIHTQDDKIKKLGTKLMRLVKDRGRMEQLAVGVGQPGSRVREVEREEMMEEVQEKVRGLQMENEGLKQRLTVAKQQLVNSQSRRPAAYGHVPPRVNSGVKKLRDDAVSPSQIRPKSSRSLEGGGRPPTGLLPRYGHNLLEEARAEIRNLENVVELQRSHVEEMERTSELLQDELRRKEAEYEQRLLQVRQQQTSKLRSHVDGNVAMIKLQKQLADRSNTVTELQGRFLQLQESQRTLKASHDVAMAKVDELSAQLKNQRLKSLDLEKELQRANISNVKTEQLQERLSEVEQERDLLKENNYKLVNSAFDVSQQQRWQIQEQRLKLQIAQLETALKADLLDKNQILDKIAAERERSEKLTAENQKLRIQFLEQNQKLEELEERLTFYSRESEYDVSELTEALLQVKTRKAQRSGDLGFLKEVEEGASSTAELRAAHADTVQELQKTRNLLSMESKICKDYKAELDAASRKMDADKAEYERQLERQAQLLDTRAAKIQKLEAQLRDIAYGAKAYVLRPDSGAEVEAEDFEETLHLERDENLLELQIVGVTLSPSALQLLGDRQPDTFCTYAFYMYELHSTPVVTGHTPNYGFTSKYVVSVDEHFLDYVHRGSVAVELHQALGVEWKTLATAQLRLQRLLERDGNVHGSAPLVGTSEEARSFGSVEFWLRLQTPVAEAARLHREKLKAGGCSPSADTQPSGGWNQLDVAVLRCTDLPIRSSGPPSPYVVYRLLDFPDYPTATVHDCCNPDFSDLKSFPVAMDADLQSELLQFYVFDYKEERVDEYVGKARVPLRPLTRGGEVAGAFELTAPSGLHAGHIEVSLRWKSPNVPPPDAVGAVDDLITEETPTPLQEHRSVDGETERDVRALLRPSTSRPEDGVTRGTELRSVAPLPKLRTRPPVKEERTAKKVSFVDPAEAKQQLDDRSSAGATVTSSSLPSSAVKPVLTPNTEEEEEEEESHFSEGQLVPAGSQSDSDVSEISEEIVEDVANQSESQSDSDDCIVQGQASARKPSERMRVEVLSLSLRPESRVARDASVVRLFVEYSLLDLPTEETPVSLPKPPQGKTINYNHSKVVPLDAEHNLARRRLLRGVLQGRNPPMERIRFTVVSEPPEEEEQERECEDVGVAYLRIPEILEKRRDLTETSLNVVDVQDAGELVGALTVSVEGLDALQAIMEDQEAERTPAAAMPLA